VTRPRKDRSHGGKSRTVNCRECRIPVRTRSVKAQNVLCPTCRATLTRSGRERRYAESNRRPTTPELELIEREPATVTVLVAVRMIEHYQRDCRMPAGVCACGRKATFISGECAWCAVGARGSA